MKIKYFFLFCALLAGRTTSAQNSPVKSADITVADFMPASYPIDSTAGAVVLYDGATAKYVSDNDGGFNIIYTYHRRVRILKRNAYEVATIDIPLFKFGTREDDMDKFEAATYTLENGAVVQTKVDKQSVFKDKVSTNFTLKKFTFPNLKEGCIIDYSYRVTSPIPFGLQGWQFQEAYPVLRSEYETFIPSMFNFVLINTGYYDLQPVTAENNEDYRITYRGGTINYNAVVQHSKWSLSNLPAMVREKYTTTVRNYISSLAFQLRSINFPNGVMQPFMRSWNELVTELMKDERFGADLTAKNNWLDDVIAPLINRSDSLETAKNIFGYVRQNFSCTDYQGIRMENSLKDVFHAGKGNIAEINLLLTAMFRKAGLQADPVLLSTRDNGFASEDYPLINKFNYTITRLTVNNTDYLLDASRKKQGFNALPGYCYNGYARIINPDPQLIPLFADSLKEPEKTTIFISNSDDGKKINFSVNTDLGYNRSNEFRDSIAKSGTEDFFKKIKSAYSFDITMGSRGIDSLNSYNDPVSYHYDFSSDFNEDIIYFNPLLAEGYKSNPFSAATRNYPVEMPYAVNKTIIVNMEIPAGYRVDELPKSVRINFDDSGTGSFQYTINADSKMIQIACKLKMNKANFDPEDYETLRQFYSEIVKKESEQIVFKKIK